MNKDKNNIEALINEYAYEDSNWPINSRAINSSLEQQLDKLKEEVDEVIHAYKIYTNVAKIDLSTFNRNRAYSGFMIELMDVEHVLHGIKNRLDYEDIEEAKAIVLAKNYKRGDYPEMPDLFISED